jgi:formylglycine-generating enzyme required for sulfatase activity
MIEKAIVRLQQAGFDFTARELAEMFWLAAHVNGDIFWRSTDVERSPQPSSQAQSDSKPTISAPDEGALPPPSVPPPRKAALTLPTSTRRSSPQPGATQLPGGIPIKVPTAVALRNSLDLARSMRPLMRKVPSPTELVLDEAETVKRIVEEKLWLPVLKPGRQRWLELALVIEQSSTTAVWKPTLAELQGLLNHHGAFRDVRGWNLQEKAGKPQLFAQTQSGEANSTPHSPKELIDARGRRLILLVSDCISPLWRRGTINSLLALWGERSLLVLLQLLPERLWERTALGAEIPVWLRSLVPSRTNSQFQVISIDDEEDDILPIQRAISVPVVTLEPKSLASLCQVIAGWANASTIGYRFSLSDGKEQPSKSPEILEAAPSISAETLVSRFRATASPLARRLAALMAAAPVSLPVVHLIQQTLLPQSSQLHVAEVFMSGLLKQVERESEVDYLTYEFVDGVREILLGSIPSGEAVSVLDKVSQYIARRLGLSFNTFKAYLFAPPSQVEEGLQGKIFPFAQLTADVLRQLGGEYISIAERLEGKVAVTTDSEHFSYQLGGSLPLDSPSYVNRQADEELYRYIKAGVFCYIFAPRQTGKSSLIVRTIGRLRQEDFACVLIDLTSISREKITPSQWYASFSNILARGFKLDSFDFKTWWNEYKEILSPVACLEEFIDKVLLTKIEGKFAIFVDELDSIFGYDFDLYDFFSLIRSLYQQRSTKLDYRRINFVFSGVLGSMPVMNINASPLTNIGRTIELEGFKLQEALPLAQGLSGKTNQPEKLLQEILFWTAGQPFLTLKICALVSKSSDSIPDRQEESWLANLIQTKIIDNWESQDEPQHFRTIRDLILSSRDNIKLLQLYKEILKKGEIKANKTQETSELQLAGITIQQEGKLKIYNPIYAQIFNRDWVEEELKQLLIWQVLEREQSQTLTPSFTFETVTVNRRGKIINRETKTARYYAEDLGNGITLDMVAIPGGKFLIGTEDSEIERLCKKYDVDYFRREKPQHEVTVQPFFMGKYPITQAEWRAITSRTDLRVECDLKPDPSNFKGDDRPVEQVSWYDAVEFCARLSKLTGREYRLPSEAEWEYACRAGTTTPFYFGETITGELANYDASSTYADEPKGQYRQETTPVGQFPPNGFGLYDMHGQVWEWCADTWHENYEGAPSDGSAWLGSEDDNDYQVLRGGSWFTLPLVCRSADRGRGRRVSGNHVRGFRVVCVSGRTLF